MMSCEKGLQKHITYAKSSYDMKILDDKARVHEEIAEEQAPVTFLDYQQVGLYISKFYQARNTTDRFFYKKKLIEIKKVYGEWLDPYYKEKLDKALMGL